MALGPVNCPMPPCWRLELANHGLSEMNLHIVIEVLENNYKFFHSKNLNISNFSFYNNKSHLLG